MIYSSLTRKWTTVLKTLRTSCQVTETTHEQLNITLQTIQCSRRVWQSPSCHLSSLWSLMLILDVVLILEVGHWQQNNSSSRRKSFNERNLREECFDYS